jgi:hypothetical protein
MSLQEEADTVGMSMHGDDINIVHDDDISCDDTSTSQEEQDSYFKFVQDSSQLVWDLQVVVASWLVHIEQNQYTNGILVDIDKLMINITMMGSQLETMGQSQRLNPLMNYMDLQTSTTTDVNGICTTYKELKEIVDKMLVAA